MATYAIGDIQGCYDELRRLLDKLEFDPRQDKLWLVGDLVNRGPSSLEVLRFVKELGDRVIMVLGNHDLHLLALGAGNLQYAHKSNLDDVLKAHDRDELLHWLRHQPLMHYDPAKSFAMIHAGLPPQWDLLEALSCAEEVEQVLRGPDYAEYLSGMYGNQPDRWSPSLSGMDRLRFITNCFTRLRYCTRDGTLGLKEKGPVGAQSGSYLPWFAVATRSTRDVRILFGHWSTLGYQERDNVWSLDSGCVWGGRLTAVRVRKDKPIKRISSSCKGVAAG
jgi:bis(5'-nucleosyl)-tetraphosphatase (symmetrical)